MPVVSIVMPVHNAERYLGAAIDSVLAQTLEDFELIVVDDGSTDRSREVVRARNDSRIRLITLPQNVGVSAAANVGLEAARSDLVARQDADDLSEPARLETQVDCMQRRPALALLGSRAIALTSTGAPAGEIWRPLDDTSIRWYALFDNPFIQSSVIFSKAAIQAQGAYRVGQRFAEDWELWCRVLKRHEVENLPDRLVRYRQSEDSVMGALDAEGGAQDYRAQWQNAVREVTRRHARLFDELVSPQDTELLSSFLLGVDTSRLDEFLKFFEQLLERFCTTNPGALASSDFRQTLARQYDAIAMRVVPASRRSAASVYAHAVRAHPAVSAYFSWSRAVALLAFGRRGRTALAAWREAVLARRFS